MLSKYRPIFFAVGGVMLAASLHACSLRLEQGIGQTYFPLEKGHQWVYETKTIGDDRITTKDVEVTDFVPNTMLGEYVVSEIDSSEADEKRSDNPLLYFYDADGGVVCLDCGGLLLPHDINVGSSWTDEQSGMRRTAEATMRLDVVGGVVYENTLLISSIGETNDVMEDHLYAENIGLVRFRRFKKSEDGVWHLEKKGRLVQHKFR